MQPILNRGGVSGATLLSSAALLVTLVIGCSGGADTVAGSADGSVEVIRRDSAGVEIVETPTSQARAPSPLTVLPEPELQIGELEGDPDYLFSNIQGVAVLPGPIVVVMDWGTSSLRSYDLSGRLVERRSGQGQGPGELQRPYRLIKTAGDSLLVFDADVRRFTLFSGQGLGFRTITVPGQLRAGAPSAGSNGQVLFVAGHGFGPTLRTGVTRQVRDVRLVDFERATIDTVVSSGFTLVRMLMSPDPNSGLIVPALYTTEPAVAAGRDGFFAATSDDPYIGEYSWTGELRRRFGVLEPLEPVTEAQLAKAIDGFFDRMPSADWAGARQAYGELQPPPFEPRFSSLIVDDEGWLWAGAFQLFPEDEPVTWLVFDTEGRGRGSVVTPAGLNVMSISRDYVAGVWRDDFDVEYVRLHRIEGRP